MRAEDPEIPRAKDGRRGDVVIFPSLCTMEKEKYNERRKDAVFEPKLIRVHVLP